MSYDKYVIITVTFFSFVTPGWSVDYQAKATFVTALYDIGRESWKHFNRRFQDYLDYFKILLSMNVNLVVFSESEVYNFVLKERQLFMKKTKTYLRRFSDLEYYSYRQIIQHVIETDDFKNDNDMTEHPEGFSVKYLILMNNKISFLTESVQKNPFNSSHFFWIDAGYGHGERFSNGSTFIPHRLLGKSGKISYIELNDPQLYRKDLHRLHKMPINSVFSGGFFGGDRKSILEYARLYKKTFEMLVTEDIVDDDQNVALHCYFECPHLFENFKGDWFDAVRLFS